MKKFDNFIIIIITGVITTMEKIVTANYNFIIINTVSYCYYCCYY